MAKWLHQRKGLLEGDIVWTSEDKVWTDIKISRDHDITNASGNTYTWPAGEVIRSRTEFLRPVTMAV